MRTEIPFSFTTDMASVQVKTRNYDGKHSYFSSIGSNQPATLNVLIIAPETTFDFDSAARQFSTRMNYAKYPNPGALEANATYWRLSLGLESFVYLPAPGTFGSGGPVSSQHEPLGAEILNAALDQIKSATGASRVNLAGQSSTAALAAAMAARRDDLRCLVLASGAYDQAKIVKESGWPSTYLGAETPFSVNAIASGIRPQDDRQIFILSDPRDEIVSPTQSATLHAKLVEAGVGRVTNRLIQSPDPRHHDLTGSALAVFADCQAA